MDKRVLLKVIDILSKKYPLRYFEGSSPFEVLVTTILSHRTKDEITEKASKRLLKKVKTPKELLELDEREIERLIFPVGFYRQKARRLREIARILVEKYGGKVPSERKDLLKLPGVGIKTADCVLCFAYGRDVIPVDTHVRVISRRLGIANEGDPEEVIREKLHRLIPKKKRRFVNSLFVEFGKEICRTVKPLCFKCPIQGFCPSSLKTQKP